ncbi:hypothetical protein, partial [Anaerostipes sp.]|uniref:hypothetical protein n=1 Tax=Anaerostipes sp. TaxID=1872530 RepID=UPI0025C54734
TASESLLQEEKLTSLRMQGLRTGQNGHNVCWRRISIEQQVSLSDKFFFTVGRRPFQSRLEIVQKNS